MKKKVLRECIELALKNTNPSHPQFGRFMHFSFYIQDNKIKGWGTNKDGEPQIQMGYPSYSKIHSEVIGYRKSKYYLKDNKHFEVVNIRTTKTMQIRQSEPCSCCSGFLANVGCQRVWFTTKNGMFASIMMD